MLKQETKNQLVAAFGSQATAQILADAIEGGGGVITDDVRRQLGIVFRSQEHAKRVADKIENFEPLSETEVRFLSTAISSWPAAVDIRDHLATPLQ